MDQQSQSVLGKRRPHDRGEHGAATGDERPSPRKTPKTVPSSSPRSRSRRPVFGRVIPPVAGSPDPLTCPSPAPCVPKTRLVDVSEDGRLFDVREERVPCPHVGKSPTNTGVGAAAAEEETRDRPASTFDELFEACDVVESLHVEESQPMDVQRTGAGGGEGDADGIDDEEIPSSQHRRQHGSRGPHHNTPVSDRDDVQSGEGIDEDENDEGGGGGDADDMVISSSQSNRCDRRRRHIIHRRRGPRAAELLAQSHGLSPMSQDELKSLGAGQLLPGGADGGGSEGPFSRVMATFRIVKTPLLTRANDKEHRSANGLSLMREFKDAGSVLVESLDRLEIERRIYIADCSETGALNIGYHKDVWDTLAGVYVTGPLFKGALKKRSVLFIDPAEAPESWTSTKYVRERNKVWKPVVVKKRLSEALQFVSRPCTTTSSGEGRLPSPASVGDSGNRGDGGGGGGDASKETLYKIPRRKRVGTAVSVHSGSEKRGFARIVTFHADAWTLDDMLAIYQTILPSKEYLEWKGVLNGIVSGGDYSRIVPLLRGYGYIKYPFSASLEGLFPDADMFQRNDLAFLMLRLLIAVPSLLRAFCDWVVDTHAGKMVAGVNFEFGQSGSILLPFSRRYMSYQYINGAKQKLLTTDLMLDDYMIQRTTEADNLSWSLYCRCF